MIMQMNFAYSVAALGGKRVLGGRSGITAGIGGFLARTLATLRAEYETRQAIRALRSLDDHMLADIGISRGTIERAVRAGQRFGVRP
jgi:uncharacterized protein YjiS (DUF1127 family)